MIYFSYHEYKEPAPEEGRTKPVSKFDQSIGQDFTIGSYTKVVGSSTSGVVEVGCTVLKPVILATLHDIKERLEHAKANTGTEDAFVVNEQTLQLFCNTTATVTLSDAVGNTLLLQKPPFDRGVPSGAPQKYIGTEVRINATLVSKGSPVPMVPTTFGDQLIPDLFLDATTSSS
jgi:hypothetical protein